MCSAWPKIALVLLAVVLYAQTPEGKRISVYTAQTAYSLPAADHSGTDYAGLFEILEPMGPTSARVDKKKWRLKFRDTDAEFEDGKSQAKIAGKKIDLGGRFMMANNRGQVPVASLPVLVTALTGTPAELHGQSRRLFVGATPVRYSAQLQKSGAPRLLLNFSSPVNPHIATDQGVVRLVFTKEPVIAGTVDVSNIGGQVFGSANFSETNGAAELAIHVNSPVIASFSDANRTITLIPVTSVAQQPSPAPAPATGPEAQAPATQGPAAPTRPPFFVLIDPAHGGPDRGAALSSSLAEKDAVLTLARRLRSDLQAKGIPVRMLREGDADIPLDRRAVVVNTSRAAAVIFVHASTVGNGVHISTAPLQAAQPGPIAWDAAQSRSITLSRGWADAAAGEILKHNIAVLRLRAAVPPLNETAVPAFVVEVTPPPAGEADALLSASYVQAITSAIADATAAERSRLEAAR